MILLGIFEDIIAGPLRDMLKSIVTNSGWMFGNGTVGTVVDSVSASPADLLGNGTWQNILYWSNIVLTPIALTLLGIFVSIEMYQLISKTNGNADIEDLTKFVLRIIIPFFIATQAVTFVTIIMDIMNSSIQLLAEKIVNPDPTAPGYEDIFIRIDGMHIGELLESIITYSIVGAISQIVVPFILMFVVYGRLFEITFLIFISPIPMASFLNSEWGGIGKQYLKYFVSLMVQGLLIILACGISDAIFSSAIMEIGTLSGILIWFVLCGVMLKTGRLSQRIVGI